LQSNTISNCEVIVNDKANNIDNNHNNDDDLACDLQSTTKHNEDMA